MVDMDTLYQSPALQHKEYIVPRDEEKQILEVFESRTDTEAKRIAQYLSMPDLSRTEGSPLKELIDRVSRIPLFKNFDHINIPEIVPASESFDLFDFKPDHPARSKSDTYYVNDTHILRTHTTVMWYYYLLNPEIKKRLENKEPIGVLSYGKVYRKDEIDRRHMNVFHQIDGLFLCPKSEHEITQDDLKNVLTEVAKTSFGEHVKYRFNPDTFPYTHSSLEMEVDKNSVSGESAEPLWVEVLGAGIVQPSVLEKLGIDGSVYNGWAFGFGLERLAIISMELPDIRLLWSHDPRVTKQLHLGQKFVEVSKYPAVVRDISFVVSTTFVPNNYFDLVRETLPDIVEEMQLLDRYENEAKFGKDMVSYAFRITYRSLDKTLTNEEVDTLHKRLEEVTKTTLQATVR
jgi:phenylalanyl-tRNA synthetase alpha chain